jgi:hypothetical protein
VSCSRSTSRRTRSAPPLETGELACDAAADRLRGALYRRFVVGHRGDVRRPDRRLSVAEQFDADRLHAADRQQQPVHHARSERAADSRASNLAECAIIGRCRGPRAAIGHRTMAAGRCPLCLSKKGHRQPERLRRLCANRWWRVQRRVSSAREQDVGSNGSVRSQLAGSSCAASRGRPFSGNARRAIRPV